MLQSLRIPRLKTALTWGSRFSIRYINSGNKPDYGVTHISHQKQHHVNDISKGEPTKNHQPEIPEWRKRNISLAKRYGQWKPTRKLSRENMNNIRELKEQIPELTTKDLADKFGISPEAIRRILKSKFDPSDERIMQIKERAKEIKEQSRQNKSKLNLDMKMTTLRLKHGKSVPWSTWKQQEEEAKKQRRKNEKPPVLMYDSSKKHSYYKKGKRRSNGTDNRTHIDSNFTSVGGIGDLID